MARLSKSHQFAIYEDICIPTADADTAEQRLRDDVSTIESKIRAAAEELEDARDLITSDEYKPRELENVQEHSNEQDDADDERRHSTLTTVSISSLPESAYEPDDELSERAQHPYTPPVSRRRFPQIESIQRLQTNSAPQFGSPKSGRILLSKSRSRNGTPKSARYNYARGSPKPRRRISEQTEAPDEEQNFYPLVLLHVTLLPVDLPWSTESMQELLPVQLLENLRLLKAKISETVLSRGILIPHPCEEYELLEERLLEALELKDERVTKCGHFRRSDTSSAGSDSDSGVGSSVDGSEGQKCITCEHRIKTSRTPVGDGNKKWSVKVFAANGLMRTSAWAAAWQDMESVDVEILPWISEDLRRKLDERSEQEEAAEHAVRRDEEDEKIRIIVEEEVRFALESLRSRDENDSRFAREHAPTEQHEPDILMEETNEEEHPIEASEDPSQLQGLRDLPPVYRPSEIPLSILLKNYMYLLAQDWRNVAIFLLSLTVMMVALLRAASPGRPTLAIYEDSGLPDLPSVPLPPLPSQLYAVEVDTQIDEVVTTNESTASMANSDSMAPTPEIAVEVETFDMLDEMCMVEAIGSGSIFDIALDDLMCPAGLQALHRDGEAA